MKKLLLLLFTFNLAFQVYAQTGVQRPGFSRGDRYSQGYDITITWHKKIIDGVDSLYARGTINPKLWCAADTILSDVYYNNGYNNIQWNFKCAESPSNFAVYIEVLTANKGNYPVIDIPDSLFQIDWWLKKGTGALGNMVSDVKDSIITCGVTGTIWVPLHNASHYKFRVITSPIHADTGEFESYLFRRER